MSDDVPTDVQTVLCQLFGAGREALEAGKIERCERIVDNAGAVATNKLPEGERRSRILHGCERVRALLGEEELAVADEYLVAMDRRICRDQ